MRSLLVLAASCIGASLAASPAGAQIRPLSLEASAYGGVWEGDARFDTGAVFGPRLQFNINRVFGVEATYGAVLTTDEPGGTLPDEDQTIHQFGFNGVLHLSAHALTPFLTAGVGLVSIDETDFSTNVGVGAKYWFTDMIAARVDIRGWFSSDAEANPVGRSGDEYAHFEATAGVSFQLMGDYDIDDDGVENRDDECPAEPEDRDGFEDDDGCPDTDNDEDGIEDADDKCPDKAEDQDGDADEDGCPDLDDDEDGVANDVDKCPAEAEDADGFEDEDGCPDKDNDGDGIEDAQDKCPDAAETKNGFEDEDGCPEGDADGDGYFDTQDQCKDQPETRNGFRDEDGCPDEVPEDLQGVLGVQTPVRFGARDATVGTPGKRHLKSVAAVLKKYPKTVVVLGATAHRGDDTDATSLARAEAVRDLLVAEGVAAEQLRVEGLGAKALPEGAPKDAREDRLEITLFVAPAQ